MRNLLNRRRDQCERLQDLLESSAADVLVASIEKLVESLPGEGRAPFADCRRGREALQDLLATRELLLGAVAPGGGGGPGVAEGGLSAIRARGRGLAFPWGAVGL